MVARVLRFQNVVEGVGMAAKTRDAWICFQVFNESRHRSPLNAKDFAQRRCPWYLS